MLFLGKLWQNSQISWTWGLKWQQPNSKPNHDDNKLTLEVPFGPDSRDHFVYAPSQWETMLQCYIIETMLQCNSIPDWLGACTKWSLWENTISSRMILRIPCQLQFQNHAECTDHSCFLPSIRVQVKWPPSRNPLKCPTPMDVKFH